MCGAANPSSTRPRHRTSSTLKFIYPSWQASSSPPQNSSLCRTSDQSITLWCCYLLRRIIMTPSFRGTLWWRPALCSSKLLAIARPNTRYVKGKLIFWGSRPSIHHKIRYLSQGRGRIRKFPMINSTICLILKSQRLTTKCATKTWEMKP